MGKPVCVHWGATTDAQKHGIVPPEEGCDIGRSPGDGANPNREGKEMQLSCPACMGGKEGRVPRGKGRGGKKKGGKRRGGGRAGMFEEGGGLEVGEREGEGRGGGKEGKVKVCQLSKCLVAAG